MILILAEDIDLHESFQDSDNICYHQNDIEFTHISWPALGPFMVEHILQITAEQTTNAAHVCLMFVSISYIGIY